MQRCFCILSLLIFAISLADSYSRAGQSAEVNLPVIRPTEFPKVGKFEVLCGDFHMHTVNSDGRLTTRERVEESARMGYHIIAITDHRTTRGYTIAKHVGEQLGLIVLRGIETGIKGAEHINAIGFSSQYEPTDSHSWSEVPNADTVYYRDELREITDFGGFVIYNHPHVGFREPVEWGVQEGLIQGIEVKNDVVGGGWNTIAWNGRHCYPDAFDYALKHNLTIFANTDAHVQRNANPAVTLVFTEARTPEAVMAALRARRTVAWFDGVLWGRKEILTDLIRACVNVSLSTGKEGKTFLNIENQSPVAFTAVINGASAEPVEIPAYQAISIPTNTDGNTVRIRWTNIWISPTENLEITHPLAKSR
ncbi:MAG: PHP domain-containing protein [Armatimonadetes bacterium]|nr:PHP domain-containing protein [Armatimonadota bacterium]